MNNFTYSDELYHFGFSWKKHKYIKKIKGKNGKWRYIYSKSLLKDEPDDSDFKEAERKYRDLYGKIQSGESNDYDTYYKLLDDYNAKRDSYNKAMNDYRNTASYKIKHPKEAIKKAINDADNAIYKKKLDIGYGIENKLGITAKHRKAQAEKQYKKAAKFSNDYPDDEYFKEDALHYKAKYEKELKQYYHTPLGKIDMYADAIKNAKKWANS